MHNKLCLCLDTYVWNKRRRRWKRVTFAPLLQRSWEILDISLDSKSKIPLVLRTSPPSDHIRCPQRGMICGGEARTYSKVQNVVVLPSLPYGKEIVRCCTLPHTGGCCFITNLGSKAGLLAGSWLWRTISDSISITLRLHSACSHTSVATSWALAYGSHFWNFPYLNNSLLFSEVQVLCGECGFPAEGLAALIPHLSLNPILVPQGQFHAKSRAKSEIDCLKWECQNWPSKWRYSAGFYFSLGC